MSGSSLSSDARKSSPMVLILLGPPGAGKGTQADLLRSNLHIPHISTGDLLRDHIRRGTELGKEANAFMSKGQLVPDQLVLDMLFERVRSPDCEKGYILDGFPRTVAQAEALQMRLQGITTPVVIHLILSDEQILERLTKRLTCERCGTPYHILYSPPKKEGICDKCGGNLIQRADDTEAVINKRLGVYHQQTAPLIDFYEHLHLLRAIDCSGSKDAIFSKILESLR